MNFQTDFSLLYVLLSWRFVSGDAPKIYFHHGSPLHSTVYQIVKGSLTGVQKAFNSPNLNTIAKDEQFTVVVDVGSPIYDEQRQWYEMPAVFCYGNNIGACLKQNRFGKPYLVRPSSSEIPVPFIAPFSSLKSNVSSDGKTIYVSGTIHAQYKTFKVNGARYDPASGLLMSFSAESSLKAGQISGIGFVRDTGKVLKRQPLAQCYFVEWSTDGCIPGLNYMMSGYDIKLLKLKGLPWLKPVKFPPQRDIKYLQSLDISGIGQKEYLVFKGMTLQKISPISNPFFYLFKSVEQRLKATLQSVGVTFLMGKFLGSAKYESYSRHYTKKAYSAAMSGTEFRLFHATMLSSFLEDETNRDEGFRTKWKNVFHQKDKRLAMDFFREYGTHYVVESVMGGRQETVFTVDYCELNKEESRKLAFETNLQKPYKLHKSRIGIESYYKYLIEHTSNNIFISGPHTTCIGGESLDSDICYNLTLWRSTVLANPHPIRMTLKPFYSLAKSSNDRLWMEQMYQEYLKIDLDETKINHDINLKVECSTPSAGGDKESKYPLTDESITALIVVAIIVPAFFSFCIWLWRNKGVMKTIGKRIKGIRIKGIGMNRNS